MLNLQFHHTGIAVNSIDEVLPNYIKLFGTNSVSPIIHIASQQVNVCFVKVGENVFIELVEAINPESSILKMAKRGVNYYHVAYKVREFDNALKNLDNLNYKIYDTFNSEAFDNKRCVFAHSPDGHLIELIEE